MKEVRATAENTEFGALHEALATALGAGYMGLSSDSAGLRVAVADSVSDNAVLTVVTTHKAGIIANGMPSVAPDVNEAARISALEDAVSALMDVIATQQAMLDTLMG